MNRSHRLAALFATLVALSLGFCGAGCNSHRSNVPVAIVDDRKTIEFLASPQLDGRGVGTAGLDEAAHFIADEFRQLGLRPLPGQPSYFQQFRPPHHEPGESVKNVLGYIRGRRAEEYVVIGAHYDHLGRAGYGPMRGKIHPGADDNASGTTAMLMLARRYVARREPPERSIIFAAFTGEEIGLWGSREFVTHPPVPLKQVVAMINLDMVGRLRPAAATQPSREILYIGGSGTAPAFDAILRDANRDCPQFELVDLDRGGIGPSDHMSFALAKIPVLFLFTGLHPDYHRPTDVATKINYRGLEEIVDFTADLADRLAVMPRQQYVSTYDAPSARIALARLLNALLTSPTTQGYSSTQATQRATKP
jgi:Zn-dependent M28 family amino/carboxypeptidase